MSARPAARCRRGSRARSRRGARRSRRLRSWFSRVSSTDREVGVWQRSAAVHPTLEHGAPGPGPLAPHRRGEAIQSPANRAAAADGLLATVAPDAACNARAALDGGRRDGFGAAAATARAGPSPRPSPGTSPSVELSFVLEGRAWQDRVETTRALAAGSPATTWSAERACSTGVQRPDAARAVGVVADGAPTRRAATPVRDGRRAARRAPGWPTVRSRHALAEQFRSANPSSLVTARRTFVSVPSDPGLTLGRRLPRRKEPHDMPVTEDEKAAKARDAALQGALTQIERQFGKGTVMRMGDEGAQVQGQRDPDRRAVARPRARHRRRAARAHRRGLRPGVLGQDDARLPRARRGPEARRRLRVHRRRARDGPALRPARSASTSTSCSSRSPTTASRRSRSPTCSCAPARSTSSRSTRSPR